LECDYETRITPKGRFGASNGSGPGLTQHYNTAVMRALASSSSEHILKLLEGRTAVARRYSDQ
jgi:hypothetical protein